MKYPNKANVNEKGLFFGFVSNNMLKREFPIEVKEVEITVENFNQIREIQKQMGAPVLIEDTFVNKKQELENFIVKSTSKDLTN